MAPPPLWNRVVSRLYNCRADSETFAQVKINFREMFKELFGEKGEADLNLIDANDPLESGIEITAKPPGKKLQSITSIRWRSPRCWYFLFPHPLDFTKPRRT